MHEYVEHLLPNDVVVLPSPYGISKVIGVSFVTRRYKRRQDLICVRVELDTCILECTRDMQLEILK